MATSREVITLQLGHYANFVGTHWWNIQESSFVYDPQKSTGPKEINHDVLFREGQNLMGHMTFTPRLILWDLKGSLHCLRREGTLYDFKTSRSSEWDGCLTVSKKSKLEKNEFLKDIEKQEESFHVPTEYEKMELDSTANPDDKVEESKEESSAPVEVPPAEQSEQTSYFGKFYNLDDSVQVWSDFLNIHLHPKSVNIINEFSHGDEDSLFDVYGCGYQTMKATDTWAEMEDRLHYFTEECDMLQGFQIMVDTHDAFSGVATSILEYLGDEFTNKSVLTFGTSPGNFQKNERNGHHLLNAALCYHQLPTHSSLFVPLSLATSAWPTSNGSNSAHRKFPHVSYKPHLNYHTSAILAAALDTCTLPYRLYSKGIQMTDITHSFHTLGRKVAALGSALPFPLAEESSLVESFLQMEGEVPWTQLSPHIGTESKPWMSSVVLRGIPEAMTKSKNISAEFAPLLSQCSNVADVLQLFLSESMPSTLNAGTTVSLPCKMAAPFPHVFDSNVTSSGLVSTMLRPHLQGVDSVPVLSALQSTKDTGEMYGLLYKEAKKLNIKRFHRFLATGLEEDDFKDTLNELANMCDNYGE